jgi:beta-N-acetylhexosaminidase
LEVGLLRRNIRTSLIGSLVGVVVLSSSACGALSSIGGSSCKWSDLGRLAAQVVVVPVDQSHVATAASAVTAGAGGVILFGKHTPSNLKDALAKLASHAPDGHAPFIMSDEEGGSVQRLADAAGKLNSARWMADHWSPAQIQQAAKKLGANMKALGVTMDLAPVLDLDAQATAPNEVNADGNRSFGIDPNRTTAAGLAFAQGLQDAAVAPVVKHFPGLGSTVGNTDYTAAHTRPWGELQKAGLEPFKAAIDAKVPAIMTANAGVPGLTDLPASLSPEVMKVLREQLHFSGVIMTDSLSAGAISANGFTPETAAVAALKAGADVILYGSDTQDFGKVTAAIVTAVNKGGLPRTRLVEAANRMLAAKHLSSCG